MEHGNEACICAFEILQVMRNVPSSFLRVSPPFPSSFLADYLFDEAVNTQTIFKTLVEPIVLSVMEGFNGKLLTTGRLQVSSP